MFGSKLRSWMDIVRPRKKQQRKEKQKHNGTSSKHAPVIKSDKSFSSENEILEDSKVRKSIGNNSRYSGTNLSSPESAYSTGYSTDGTSPGAPPEYYINIRTGTRYFPSSTNDRDGSRTLIQNNHISLVPNQNPNKVATPSVYPTVNKTTPSKNDYTSTLAVRVNGECTTVSMTQDYERCKNQQTTIALNNNINGSAGIAPRVADVVVNSSITSPRQRNRIRTNPWLPGSNMSPCKTSATIHSIRQDPTVTKAPVNNASTARYGSSTIARSPLSKQRSRRESSSSSCSSLSAASVSLNWSGHRRSRHTDSEEEDDCTLNEMMGKYDESYIYEKETDILSDSDPTDCETDIDTGQDGGDEDEPLEREFDFIDNSSFLEFNINEDRNTGHCTYYNFETQRKPSRRRASRRSKQDLQTQNVKPTRRRSCSSKKRQKPENAENAALTFEHFDGSRSAGATPVSARRTKQHPISKLALEDNLKRRSNSVSLSRDVVNTFDQRDKEADKMYKELIVEAEHILMSMKQTGLSPRRLPGPANKRVELLKTESAKTDMFNKVKPIDDLPKYPSNNFSVSRYSPKRNHLTNFINNNSPVLIRKDLVDNGLVVSSPLVLRKDDVRPPASRSPALKKKQYPNGKQATRSPKYRKKIGKTNINNDSNSSDEDDHMRKRTLVARNTEMNTFCCPQSEPVKRKIYHQSKTVAFNLNYESICNLESDRPNQFGPTERRSSLDNLRQQVLLNTIANLKKSLEDQSASLKQVYKSSQNIKL